MRYSFKEMSRNTGEGFELDKKNIAYYLNGTLGDVNVSAELTFMKLPSSYLIKTCFVQLNAST